MLAALAELLADVTATGQGRLVLVRGEAGVGKTALVRRFCEDEQPARVLWGGCDALFTPRPLGPFLDVAHAAGGELDRVATSGAKPYEVAAALMRELEGSAACIVVVEDVHWADEATLDVLRIVARRIEALPALIVATYRDDELDRRHPLRMVLGELAFGQRTARVVVESLSPDCRRSAGGAARRRCRRSLPEDERECVLRHRGARLGRRRGTGHRPRRRARACGEADPGGAGAARGRRRDPAPRRPPAARRARPRGGGVARGMPDLRDVARRAGAGLLLPSRARAPGDRGLAVGASPRRSPPARARGACGCSRRAAGPGEACAPRRGRRRRRRRAAVRARGRRPSRLGGSPSRGRRSVRPGTPGRAGAPAGQAGGASRTPGPRLLPDRPEPRGGDRARGCARLLPPARRPPGGGPRRPFALALPVVSGQGRGGAGGGSPVRRPARAARAQP